MRNVLLMGLAALVLSACGGGGSSSDGAPVAPPATAAYSIAITNLTNAQPLSPPVAALHQGGFRIFTLGEPAGDGLEELAEGGDSARLRSEAGEADGVIAVSAFPEVIPPGATAEVELTVLDEERTGLTLSLATMLVNTNDAFSGANRLMGLGDLAPGDSLMVQAVAYDAGTEADSEGPGTIPGPADGGEGFNAARDDDADRVSMHAGVVTASDGLPTSVLTEAHRFDNPVLRVRVTRVN